MEEGNERKQNNDEYKTQPYIMLIVIINNRSMAKALEQKVNAQML